MDIYAQIVVKIVQAQEAIIGPVAVEQAQQVANVKLNWDKHEATVSGDEEKAVDDLVGVFERLFGRVSVEVSKEATASLTSRLQADQIPDALK